jgi:acetyl-CoA C-acetyltransferase
MNRPVVIGISSIQQKGNFETLDEALLLMNQATNLAIKDSTNPNITNYIDEIQIPKGYWKYRDPGKWIAEKNGISPVITSVTKIGILQQNLINNACTKIINNEIQATLIVGGEARFKKIRGLIEGKDFIETELLENPNHYIKAENELHIKEEKEELGLMAVGYYAILESALRASLGLGIKEHQEKIGRLYETFSSIASMNPDSWMTNKLSWTDIATSSKENPVQASPYNKYHCTSWNVNQASAMILCNESLADELHIPIEKRIYPLASSETNHMIATIQRPNIIKPLGLELAANFILDLCKKNNLTANTFELYSCFPSAVQMFSKALGLKEEDIKTVTGGMSFAGGPLNNYMIHSTVKMLSDIRKDNNKIGLVTSVSGMMTKQAFALWAKNPLIDFISKDVTEEAKKLEIPIPLSELIEGKGIIIGYTTFIDKADKKPKAVIYITDSNGKRKVLISRDISIINNMGEEEWVGKEIHFKDKYLVS